jgi:hypothetical protein
MQNPTGLLLTLLVFANFFQTFVKIQGIKNRVMTAVNYFLSVFNVIHLKYRQCSPRTTAHTQDRRYENILLQFTCTLSLLQHRERSCFRRQE